MKSRLWAVEIAGRSTEGTTYSVIAPSIEQAMKKAVAEDKKNWSGDFRGKSREVVSVSLEDRDPVL
jgi:hypothetical protein